MGKNLDNNEKMQDWLADKRIRFHTKSGNVQQKNSTSRVPVRRNTVSTSEIFSSIHKAAQLRRRTDIGKGKPVGQCTIYLIDSENVADHWVGKIKLATAQDRIVIFWSRNCKGISLSLLPQFLNAYPKEQLEFVECYTGTNAMDFHIVAKLGQMLAETPKRRFVVVSNDTGYDAVINHLHDEGFSVARFENCNKDVLQMSVAREMRAELILSSKTAEVMTKRNISQEPHNSEIVLWGMEANGKPYEIEIAKKRNIDKKIDAFFRRHPEAVVRRKDIVKILSTTTYPSKENAVTIYNRLVKLPNAQIAKMAAIYRAMKQELLPALDSIVCP